MNPDTFEAVDKKFKLAIYREIVAKDPPWNYLWTTSDAYREGILRGLDWAFSVQAKGQSGEVRE